VARALDPASQLPQPTGTVVRGIALAGDPGGIGIVPRVQQGLSVEDAILRNEEKDQPVDDTQELAVEVIEPQRPAAERFAQPDVLRVSGETRAQDLQDALDAAAQFPQRPRALPFRLAGPLLQPACLGPFALPRCEARCVSHEPQEHEVGVDLARENRIEIELEPGLPGQRLVVPEDAQAQAVRDDRPQARFVAVEQILHEPVRVARRRSMLAGGTAVEREAASSEVYGHRPEAAANGVGAAVDLRTGGRRQETEPELAKQRQAPLLVGEARPGDIHWQVRGARMVPDDGMVEAALVDGSAVESTPPLACGVEPRSSWASTSSVQPS